MGNFLKKILSHRSHSSISGTRRVYRRWGISLALLVFVIIAFAVFAGYLFFGINEGTLFVPENEMTTSIQNETLNQEQLQTTLEFYRNRTSMYERFVESSPNAPRVR